MRRLCALLAILVTTMSMTGCESFHGKSPFETSVPSGKFGLRVTDGQLRVWTGSPCSGTTQVDVDFGSPGAQLHLNTPSDDAGVTPGVEFEYLTVPGPYPGFQVKQALSPEFDWRTATLFSIGVYGPPVARGIGGLDFAPIATEIEQHSSEHPDDTYFFPDLGWLGPAEVAARDGTDFLTICTPDPAKDESVTATVGVRVTDGTLRFWMGARCAFDAGVILTFQPGQADEVLQSTRLGPGVERLTLGTPDPDFTVTHPLPTGFDWRTARSVLLRLVTSDGLVWSKSTDLSIPIRESDQHPADMYYFQGIGWVGPADVSAASVEPICGG